MTEIDNSGIPKKESGKPISTGSISESPVVPGGNRTKTPKLHDVGDQKALDRIRGDLARFNLNLTGLNEPWQPTDESGLPKAPDPAPSAELARELTEPIKIKDPKTGQSFNTLQLNWEKRNTPEGQRVLVFMPPFNNKIDKGATHYRIQELARQSGMPTLAIDHPSMGQSAKLTKEQRKSLAGEEGYGEIAEAELRIMQELGIKEIDLVGQSLGAFAVAELAKKAASAGIKVKNLVLVETPGVEEFSLPALGGHFKKEGDYLDIYTDHPHDPQQIASSGGPLSLKQMVKIGVDSVKPDALRYSVAMAKESIYKTAKEVLEKNTDVQVTFVNGTMSRISPAEKNRNIVAQLGKDGYGGRVRHMVFPGEPHTVMESAKRFGALTRLLVTQPKR